MLRSILLDGAAGKRTFELLYVAYLAGARSEREAFEDVKADSRLLHALQGVSVPVVALPPAAPPPRGRERTLREGPPQTLTLRQDDFERLLGYVRTTRWAPETRLDVVTLEAQLTQIPPQAPPTTKKGK